MFFGLLLAAVAVLPTPCASTTSDCTEWIKPAGQQSRIRAFVFVHGILRDADNHFRTYLLGEADVLPLGVFDVSCPAMAQGPTRLGRGLAFHSYVNEHLHAHHNVVVVPFCSHSQRCMFTSAGALSLIFPN